MSIVGHATGTFLNLTEGWVYNQIIHQSDYQSVVLTERLANQALFPLENVHSLQQLSASRRIMERCQRLMLYDYFPHFYRLAVDHRLGLLHAHHGGTGLKFLTMAKALNVPLITSFYGKDTGEDAVKRPLWRLKLSRETYDQALYLAESNGRLPYRLRRIAGNPEAVEYAALFSAGDLFLVEGAAAKDQLEHLGCPSNKIRIQRLGVDLQTFSYRHRNIEHDQPVRILMAATFTEKKGMPYGVEAFCQVAVEDPRLLLTVVGDADPRNPAQQQIKVQLTRIVNQYNVGTRVNFLGYVTPDQLMDLAYQHHIFMHPSITAVSGDNEGGSPVVITQMAATGLPVLATKHRDIPQVVLHGETGLLVAERNVDQLRAALTRIIGDDESRLRMGERGREHVEQYFCVRRQGAILAEIYKEVLCSFRAEREARRMRVV